MTATRTTKKAKKPKPSIFSDIAAGLTEAISIAKGEANSRTFRAHVPKSVDVRALRRKLGVTQEVFSVRYGFTVARVRDWEQGRSSPGEAERAYLKVIEKKPEEVQAALSR